MAEEKKSNTLLMIIVIVSVQLIVTAAIMFILMKKIDKTIIPVSGLTENSNKKENNQNYVENKSEDSNFSTENKDYFKEFTIYNNPELDNIAVNIKNTSGHYLAIKIGLEYRQSDKKLPEEINLKIQLIKNNLIEYLSSIELENLQDIDFRPSIKDDIKQIINNIITNGQISRVLFTQYVIQ